MASLGAMAGGSVSGSHRLRGQATTGRVGLRLVLLGKAAAHDGTGRARVAHNTHAAAARPHFGSNGARDCEDES